MRYFIDTEFIEGFHKPLFGKKRHFIDLISIGIICEDGRTYSAISNEYNIEDSDDWVISNVITPLYENYLKQLILLKNVAHLPTFKRILTKAIK